MVDLEYLGRPSLMILVVVLQQDQLSGDAMRECINAPIRTKASSHHVPDEVMHVADVPRNCFWSLTLAWSSIPLACKVRAALPSISNTQSRPSPVCVHDPTSCRAIVLSAAVSNSVYPRLPGAARKLIRKNAVV